MSGQYYGCVERALNAWRERLVEASHDLHAHPELGFEEHRSAGVVAGLLRAAGFRTELGVYGLETAVEAVYGDGEMAVVICAEYDALPGLGHACGHNIIATAAVGAAVALSGLADELNLTVKALGTPAEENGGGKVVMLEAGAWDDATVSLMVHPRPGRDTRTRGSVTMGNDRFLVTFTGRAAHASAAPHVGVNAGDAAVLLHVALGLLRQQLPDRVRLSAVTLSGGEACNIIPGTAVVEGEVRSEDAVLLRDLKRKFLACVEGAALATGCTFEVVAQRPVYEPMVQHGRLADGYDAALLRRGRVVEEVPTGHVSGSTDMGNVSRVVPSIHPFISVLGAKAPPHSSQFATDARSHAADEAIVDGAYGLACAVVDLALDPEARAEVLADPSKRH